MIQNIVAMADEAGNILVNFDSDIDPARITDVFVEYGPTSAYELGQAFGTITGPGASGTGAHCECSLPADPSIASGVHFRCNVSDGATTEQSDDQTFNEEPDDDSKLALDVTPDEIKVGEVATLKAKVTLNGAPLAGAKVRFRLHHQACVGHGILSKVKTETDANGIATVTLKANRAGKIVVVAKSKGERARAVVKVKR